MGGSVANTTFRARAATTKQRRRPLSLYLFVVASCTAIGFPLLWMILAAFKPIDEIITPNPVLLPIKPTLANFVTGWARSGFSRFFLNSAIIASVASLLSIVINSMAGYGFAKFSFRGRDVLFILVLSAIMFPDHIRIIPMYLMMVKFHWVDTYQAVIVPGISQTFGLFLMKQYIQTIPDEIIESARIDGCPEWRIFWQLIFPLCGPAVAALAIFQFMSRWNDLLWPIVVLKSTLMYTVQIALALFRSDVTVGGGPLMAMALVSSLPILALFFAFQRYFVQGIAMTGLK